MGASNLTENYDLPLFADSDKPTWRGDVNSAMVKIDTAIHDVREEALTHTDTVVAGISTEVESLGSAVESVTTAVGDKISVETATNAFMPKSARGAVDGVASLDNGGKIPTGQIPSLPYVVPSSLDNYALRSELNATVGPLENNAIFNGDFSLARLGTSIAALTHLDTCFDRFIYGQQGGGSTFRWDADTDVPDSTVPFSSKFTVTAASSVSPGQEKHVRYAIEGKDFLPFRGKTGTLTFWVKGSTPGKYSVAFTNYVRDRTYVAEYTLNSANVWQEVSITVPFNNIPANGGWDYDTLQGLGIRFCMVASSTYQGVLGWNTENVTGSANQTNLGAANGNFIKFAKVQFNLGDSKLPFSRRSAEDNLRACSRYMQVFSDADFRRTQMSSVTTGSVCEIYVPLPTPMRGVPKARIIGTRGVDWTLRASNDVTEAPVTAVLNNAPTWGKSSGLLRFEGPAGAFTAGQQFGLLFINSNARIVFDAEL